MCVAASYAHTSAKGSSGPNPMISHAASDAASTESQRTVIGSRVDFLRIFGLCMTAIITKSLSCYYFWSYCTNDKNYLILSILLIFNNELFNSSKFSLLETTNTETNNIKTSITGTIIIIEIF